MSPFHTFLYQEDIATSYGISSSAMSKSGTCGTRWSVSFGSSSAINACERFDESLTSQTPTSHAFALPAGFLRVLRLGRPSSGSGTKLQRLETEPHCYSLDSTLDIPLHRFVLKKYPANVSAVHHGQGRRHDLHYQSMATISLESPSVNELSPTHSLNNLLTHRVSSHSDKLSSVSNALNRSLCCHSLKFPAPASCSNTPLLTPRKATPFT